MSTSDKVQTPAKILEIVTEILRVSFGLDDEKEINLDTSLVSDLEGEQMDFLDAAWQLKKQFCFKASCQEVFPLETRDVCTVRTLCQFIAGKINVTWQDPTT